MDGPAKSGALQLGLVPGPGGGVGLEIAGRRSSRFTVVVFIALAWLRDPGQHIGKIPGAPLIPATGISRGSGIGLGQGLARAGIYR